MVRFSVKKPFTVLVAVVAVIVFGVISYIKMVPDLLPSMDYPYVVVVTTYPGAAPEEVETTVTKPLEQSMATLNNIKSVSSSSSANYGMLILEFEQTTNMDGAMVDILQATQQVEGGWDESVGTPTIIRINPNMIPVMIAAVGTETMDRYDLCRFAGETLIPELEGTTGLASVSTGGFLERQVTIDLNEKKLEDLNKKVEDAIDAKMQEARDELSDAQEELDDAKKQVEDGKKQLTNISGNSMKMDINTDKIEEFVEESVTIGLELEAAKIQKQDLEKEKQDCEAALENLKQKQADLEASLAAVQNEKAILSAVLEQNAGLDDSTPVGGLSITTEQSETVSALGLETLGDIRLREASNATQELSLQADIISAAADVAAAEAETALRVAEINAAIAVLDSQIATLEAQGQKKADQIQAARKKLDNAANKIMEGMVQVSMAGGQLAAAETSLNAAQEQLDAAKDTFNEQVEAAVKAADMHNVLTLETLSGIIYAQNFDMPAGYAYDKDGNSVIVTAGDKIGGLEDLRNLVLLDLGLDDLGPIHLVDVADLIISDNSGEIYATLNGDDSLVLMFSKQSNYATASVSDNLLSKFKNLEEKYPGIHFSPLMDQGEYIYLIRDSILSSLGWGALFSVLILFLFLRDWRPTVITLCSIPISLLLAFTLMYFTGVSINLISLSGLAISVGMLVDNSVVVIENTYRLRDCGENTIKAAVSGAGQVAGAVAASTLTTICVFAPIVFITGLTKELFLDMVLTLTYALLASLAVSLTVVPALASRILEKAKPTPQGALSRLMPAYKNSVVWGVKHKGAVLGAAAGLLALGAGLVLIKGFTFLPEMEMEQMMVYLTMPEGSSFQETTAMADEAARIMASVNGVETVGGMIEDGGDSTSLSASSGDVSFYVLLTDDAPKPGKVAKAINEACAGLDCEIEADASSLMSTFTELMSGSGVTINIYGNDLNDLQKAADEASALLGSVEGISSVTGAADTASGEIHYTVNKEKAAENGLTVAQAYMQIATALTSSVDLTEINDGGDTYKVILKTKDESELTPEYLNNYTFTVTDNFTQEEKTVKLSDIADSRDERTPSSISRSDQRRYISITGEVAEGYNVTKVSAEARKVLDGMQLPEGVKLSFSGENEAIMDAMKQLLELLLVGILMVYLVMVAQFQNLKAPFIVMFTVPLAFTGGFLALFITGMELSLLSMLGMIMLVGIIVNNGIVLVDYVNQLRQQGTDRIEAIAEAAVTRLRPILMTSITTILGLLVMALGQNEATSFVQPLAVTCIGGLTYGTLLTLYVIPVMYDIFSKRELLTVSEEDLELSKL